MTSIGCDGKNFHDKNIYMVISLMIISGIVC